MNYDPEVIQKAKDRIYFLLRQADNGEPLPKELPTTPYITELVDEQTAQKLYRDILVEIERLK